MPQRLKNAAFILALLLLTIQHAYAQEVFATFEKQEEIASIKTTNDVRLAASKRFPAWNTSSLEAAFPSNGGTLELTKIPQDWRRKESLLLFACVMVSLAA